MGTRSYLQKSLARDPKMIEAKVFLKDPLFARESPLGLKTVELLGEPWLGAGPTTSRLKVVDHDDATGATHEPAGVLATGNGFAVGRKNPLDNFKFHQVNVWAIITRILDHIESPKVFGRRIPWAFPHGRLLIRPHAGVDENAYYDRESGGIHFFYFPGPDGRTVYTCLSHDVIVHEFGHAVLDGLKPLYYEISSPDVAGFHEYFGDALAMTSTLTLREIVAEVVGDAPQTLRGRNLVSDIAREFGTALYGTQPYLRTAENRMTMARLAGNFEEHDYSLVLTGAYYDVLQEIYTRDLKRQRKTAGNRKPGQLAVAALINAANCTSRLMLRGLDYCPPAGLTYRDYARAVIRADQVAYPVDSSGYRQIAAEVFVKRGVVDSLEDLQPPRQLRNNELRPYDVERIAGSQTDAYTFVDRNRETLGIPRDVDFEVSRVYRTRKIAAAGHYPPREVVVEFVWRHEVELEGRGFGQLAGESYPLWCGGTLVFDSNHNVLHYVLAGASRDREQALRAYIRYLVEEGYMDQDESAAAPRVQARVENGRLQLRRSAALRHIGRGDRKR